MIGRLLAFVVLSIVLVLAYLRFLSPHLASVAPMDSVAEWVITALIGAAVGFATGMWRRGNPWYIYVIAALICLGARSISYFVLGAVCTYAVHCT